MNKRLFITNDEYRKADGISNSELMLIERCPSDYIWSQTAPVDVSKSKTADFGTALHTALLEPEKFDDLILVSSVAGRTTKTFEKEVTDNPDNIVLTESEAQQIRVMQASGMCHPRFKQVITAKGHRESSVFVFDKERDIAMKIRPDIDAFESSGFLADAKSVAEIEGFRSDREWLNPLYKFGYGHIAAYYLHVSSLFYGEEVKNYKFACLQKTIEMGRYPVAVFNITKQELIDYGFWDRMLSNLDRYAECLHADKWDYDEHFPIFGDFMQITTED